MTFRDSTTRLANEALESDLVDECHLFFQRECCQFGAANEDVVTLLLDYSRDRSILKKELNHYQPSG
jgi:uncharacterized protein YqkB